MVSFFLIFKSIYQKKWSSTKSIQKVKKTLLGNKADKASINTHAKKNYLEEHLNPDYQLNLLVKQKKSSHDFNFCSS